VRRRLLPGGSAGACGVNSTSDWGRLLVGYRSVVFMSGWLLVCCSNKPTNSFHGCNACLQWSLMHACSWVVLTCGKPQMLKTVVTCEIKLLWNNFEIIYFTSHVTTTLVKREVGMWSLHTVGSGYMIKALCGIKTASFSITINYDVTHVRREKWTCQGRLSLVSMQ